MARSKGKDACEGFVGGDIPGGDDQGYYCPDFGPMKHMSDRLAMGSEHEYLGHFRQQKYAREGHNDIDQWTGKINGANDQNNYVGATEQGVAPGSSGSAVGQFASISGAGNPL